MWETLGFRESPYNTSPLKSRAEDVELLVGRQQEAVEFCTTLETASEGILVLSGVPGVGKTSFFNVQQYLLENQLSPFGPKLLAARSLCPIQPTDDVRSVALRALESLHRSISSYCTENSHPLPSETKKVGKWLRGEATGFDLGIQIAGFGGNIGRSVMLPALKDATFEAIADAIHALSAEVCIYLHRDCAVIVLDNVENLDDKQLGDVLISFRDTLFSTPHIWWIVIGQSGLGSLIQSLDPRVFERTAGSGLEIKPIELEELHAAISLRVKRFHKSGNGAAPLSKKVHERLFIASHGEMRFVFKYSNSICLKHIEDTRTSILAQPQWKAWEAKPGFKTAFAKALDMAIANMMINSHIPDKQCDSYLRKIIEKEISGLQLKAKEKSVLDAIGDKKQARASDFKEFAVKSAQDFSSNYLSKFHHQNLLARKQEGRAVNYRLRGAAYIAHSCGLLK
jgi:hypothetical protein